jgi:UDP-N-acetyl-D-glucosamine/UDP-N-acetyl-D-galactosamine dehydrogenase
MIEKLEGAVVCIVGLGYVGLPLAQAFSKKFKVIGFDTNSNKIRELSQRNYDRNSVFTDDAKEIGQADFIIIAVPTPVTRSKEPDLSFVESAAEIAARNMKKGATVILESTVYPGVTEEIVRPILEQSGLKCGRDFKLAYSPERINPGDKEHSLDKITKVVAGMDVKTTELVARLYNQVSPHIFKAKDIKTAEAAKVIENIQRDLNIALMNELSLIFAKLGLSTKDVLAAAATKWNFHRYSPGLVGGHCIPVDPYYLVYKARELGYHSQVILAGRAINDYMPEHVAEMTIKALNNAGKVIRGSKVLIMGLTYKENVADIRETPVKEIIKQLQEYGVDIYGYDPLLDDIEQEFGIKAYHSSVLDNSINSTKAIHSSNRVDVLVIAVAHDAFKDITLDKLRSITKDSPILIDVRGFFDGREVQERGFIYRNL